MGYGREFFLCDEKTNKTSPAMLNAAKQIVADLPQCKMNSFNNKPAVPKNKSMGGVTS